MDHKLDGFIEDMRGIRLDIQEIKTRIALIERGYAPNSQSFDRMHPTGTTLLHSDFCPNIRP